MRGKLYFITMILLVLSAAVFGQKAKPASIKSETLTEIPAELREFIPHGYSFLSGEKGDLNLDRFPDIVLVLKKDNEADTLT